MVELGFIHGRFQLFHNDHLQYALLAKEQCEKLIVGITEFAPMDYHPAEGSTEWIGFDADMSRIVAQKLGVEIEFIVIDWNNKVFELDGKSIDVVWNGMTLTDAVKAAMECTNAYCENAQVVVKK